MKFFAVAVCLGVLASARSATAELCIAEVAPGIYRGPAPTSAADFRQLRELGIRTLLDLRKSRLRKMEAACRGARAHGMNYHQVPVAFRPERDGSAERALQALLGVLRDARRSPVYIHCELGRDRSGLIIGMYRARCEGWTLRAAYCEMRRFGFNQRLRGLERYFWEHARR